MRMGRGGRSLMVWLRFGYLEPDPVAQLNLVVQTSSIKTRLRNVDDTWSS